MESVQAMGSAMGESEKTPRRFAKKARCAIYTRKSSEEGLEQAFNSLDAQREACAAFILSQKLEGWTVLPTLYDDGGFSGATMERPALKRLIEAGEIDVVVVYKVDRLTRALSDFAKLVEVFDRRGVSFVSITQQFNTTTSMGRLTLNVLLSFAQFEREVTGERIRDKIAASKKKGLWMGGMPPLGYDVKNRKLIVNEAEARIVVDIFRRYLALKSVHALRDELAGAGIKSKLRVRPPWRAAPVTGRAPARLQARTIRDAHRANRPSRQHRAWEGRVLGKWERTERRVHATTIFFRRRRKQHRPLPICAANDPPRGRRRRSPSSLRAQGHMSRECRDAAVPEN
jgi:DNA invertase Pin-like site-specific DNA recombinase